jgi:hypothetical protein
MAYLQYKAIKGLGLGTLKKLRAETKLNAGALSSNIKSPKFRSNQTAFKKGFKKGLSMTGVGKVLGLAATVTAGAYAVSAIKKQKLQKNDPRYKALKKKGYV